MADQVILDAMIRRADFAIGAVDVPPADQIQTLSVESLSSSSLIVAMLRKPDFQRETNQWTPDQLVSFLESFLDHELIPSIILWRSPAYVFVIDGGHRLSALRAWIEDDYGDSAVSRQFYNNEISIEQKRIADRARKLVEDKVGSYAKIKKALLNPSLYSETEVSRGRNMATRQLALQWVTGDAEKAETSFFNINTQGTALDETEELLLRNRRRSVAIAARSILRAATGHKYWSKFDADKVSEIESLSKKLHDLVFRPEIVEPIKTLALPMGGRASPIAALELLIKLISITNASQKILKPTIEDFEVDEDGSATIGALKKCLGVMERLTGNSAGSLGLHPAVYFYSEKGRHSADMMLGVAQLVARHLTNNNDKFFQDFIRGRKEIERFLCDEKPLIAVLLQALNSRKRVESIASFFSAMIERVNDGFELNAKWAIEALAPNSRAKVLMGDDPAGTKFSKDTKSALYLKQSLEGALKCSVCGGYLEPSISVSYDHHVPARDGGRGTLDNGRLTHPFCNTGIKS